MFGSYGHAVLSIYYIELLGFYLGPLRPRFSTIFDDSPTSSFSETEESALKLDCPSLTH